MRRSLGRLLGLAALVVAAPLLSGATTPKTDLSTPEKTVEVYYRGYETRDKALIAATMLHGDAGRLENSGLGGRTRYRIMEKRLILESRLPKRRGDLQVVVHADWVWGHEQAVRMITTFHIRRIGREWKIVAYDSTRWNGSSPD
jgi:hypothetical protein